MVHFDGHGAFLDATVALTSGSGSGSAASSSSSVKYSVTGSARPGRHGYLLFESVSEDDGERQLVDGATLAGVLVETGVPVLVLNACRSAYSEPPSVPGAPGDEVDAAVLAYGSLAQEVAHAGVPGVVAMRYTVYVVTAAQFVADLYRQLLAGRTLGQATTVARKALHAQPVRQIAAKSVSLQGWVVPTVYEAAPLTLFSRRREAPAITIGAGQSQRQSDQGLAAGVPRPPDVGFFGRDETILALDRAFDSHRIVLLHAYAGAGKSTTAGEFARWYQNTGGLDHGPDADAVGPIVWNSFEHYLLLPRVLDTIGSMFDGFLEANGIHWAAIADDDQRRDLILKVLNIVPTLWIWDNVEPVTGLPTGNPSSWTAEEQHDLVEFLRDVRDRTRARILLTSRRPETAWLGEVAARVQLPPMPMRESLQLAEALADHHGSGHTEIDWRPLLRFTGGNPLTITVTVGQVLHEQLTGGQDLNDLITRIHSGGTTLATADNRALGRDHSLAASLDYRFRTAFTPTEHAQLAVLHLFRNTIDVDTLRYMGDPKVPGENSVPALAGLTRDTGIHLLDRATEVGLLNPYGGGYYGIHPALPWYFTTLYNHHHPTTTGADTRAEHAYLHAIAALGNYYLREVGEGHAGAVSGALRAEEGNLRHGLDLARTHRQPGPELGCLQGLQALYRFTGRTTQWARLVHQITPDYLDPTTNTPLRSLAISLQDVAQLQAEQDNPVCLDAYTEALNLAHRITDTPFEANLASSIGNAYLTITALYDLDQAHTWHQKSLTLRPDHDHLGNGASHGQLAAVAYQRFLGASATGTDRTTQLGHLNDALAGYQTALTLTPPDHHEFLAVWHNQLGLIHNDAGDPGAALRHYQQSLTHDETRGDTYGPGRPGITLPASTTSSTVTTTP